MSTDESKLTPSVVAGKHVWEKHSCINCHTLLGEGAYFAPELGNVWVRYGGREDPDSAREALEGLDGGDAVRRRGSPADAAINLTDQEADQADRLLSTVDEHDRYARLATDPGGLSVTAGVTGHELQRWRATRRKSWRSSDFWGAMILFLAQVTFGVLAGSIYVFPNLLSETLPFHVLRMIHTNALLVWLLLGFFGATYYLIPEEAERDIESPLIAKLQFWIFFIGAAVAVVGYLSHP